MVDRIRKIDGQYESFSEGKLKKSLMNSGASEQEAEYLVGKILEKEVPKNTKELHNKVYQQLLSMNKSYLAARYSLKRALHSLGPTGFPFEKYIASIYRTMGYEASTNIILKGACVDHEMDVIARANNEIIYIECKYHQSRSAKSNVKIPLYVKSRTDDLYDHQKTVEGNNEKRFSYFIATNTRFTSDAVQYASCKNINLLGWDQPHGESLPKIIDRYGLHPVTILTGVTKKQAVRMIEQGVVQVKDVPGKRDVLSRSGVDTSKIDSILAEAEAILIVNNHSRKD